MSDNSSTKRLAKNTLMMYIRMGITMIVGLVTARVVLQSLGVEDFGLYNAVNGIVVLITFLNNSLTLATQRYLSYAMGINDVERIRNVFNASYIIYIGLALLVLLLGETLGLWFLNTKMEFPDGKENLANFVYQFSLIITCLNIIRAPYSALFISAEKLDFYAISAIVESVLHLIFVFLLLVVPFSPSYVYVVFQMLTSLAILMWFHVYYKKCFGSQVTFHRVTDKNLFKEILSFSGWGVLGSSAVIGFQQGINILLNIFFGVTINASFGIANRVSAMVNQFFTGFQTAANPQITKAYASGDVSQQTNLINKTSKISFFLLMIVGIAVIYNVEYLLKVWLKEVPAHTEALCSLMIIGAMVDALSSPLYVTVYATGKVKWYQIVISIILLMNLVLSYIFFRMEMPVESCMYARIGLFIVAYIARLFFVKHYTSIDITNILREVIVPVVFISAIVSTVVFFLWGISNPIIRLFVITPTLLLFMLSMSYFIGCNKNEKQEIAQIKNKYVKSKIRHKV